MPIEHIRTGEVDTAYSRKGSGPPLLLLHGGEANLSYYDEFAERVSPVIETIAYDQRDCGQSVFVPERPYELIEVAEDAINLIKELGYERVNVMGSSAGGVVAQLMAANWPERIDRLILNVTADPAAFRLSPESPIIIKRAALIAQGDHKGIAELFSSPAYVAKHPELVERFKNFGLNKEPSPQIKRRMAALMGQHLVDYSKITHQTLIIAGEIDQLVTTKDVAAMASRLPHADMKVIPEAGHTALLEEVDMYASLVKSFLEIGG